MTDDERSLAEQNYPLVFHVMRKMGVDHEDYHGAACIGLCKVGGTVWVIERCGNVRMSIDDDYETGTGAVECPFENSCDIEDCGDDHVRIFETTLEDFWYGDQDACHPEVFLAHIGHGYMRDDFGKTVFLTREEAETALKEATPCTE